MRSASLFCIGIIALAAFRASAEDKKVSYYKDLVPIFKRSCTGCHHPGKLKGQLDLTTYEALKKGGKHGPSFVSGDPKKSSLIEEIAGEEPSMPKEGDPLTKDEVALFERWIAEGAGDDTPAGKLNPFKLAAPPVYQAPALISAAVYSPDGEMIAVSGYHEVLLQKADGSGLIGRLVGESPRIEALAFSPDGKFLAACGGAPSQFGEVQIWDLAAKTLSKSYKISPDSLYGISYSPNGEQLAFGGADKSVRVIAVADGKELMKFDNHTDWVFGTTFTVDGKRLLTGSRDRAMKLINVANGQFIDDINKLLEGVLCIARHPKNDQILYGGDLGTARFYRIAENQGRTAANNDVNLIKEFERQPAAVRAVAFSPDGKQVALGSIGEVRIYKTDGALVSTLKGHEGAIFSISYHPSKPQVLTGGYDGTLRIFDPVLGTLAKSFVPFPIQAKTTVASQP